MKERVPEDLGHYELPSGSDWGTCRMPTPNDLFEVARHSAAVKHCLDAWRAGHWPLEKALIAAVVFLARENESLREHATMRIPTGPIFVPDVKRT